MKTNWLFPFFLLFCTQIINAQGIYHIYGMTSLGGDQNLGVVFRTDGTGDNLQVLHHFERLDARQPMHVTLLEDGGVLYGTSYSGTGPSNNGVLYNWNPVANHLFHIADFNASAQYPYGGLTRTQSGRLIGVTRGYGCTGGRFGPVTCNHGTIYEYNKTTKTIDIKIQLGGTDGSMPYSPPLEASNGKMYGMTYGGGTNGAGVLYEWDPQTNVYVKLKDLDNTSGTNPIGSFIEIIPGKLLGLTVSGGTNNGGTLFEYDINAGTFTKLYDFSAATGVNPYGTLTLADNGRLYGLTRAGGANNLGAVFEWNASSTTFTQLSDLSSTTGHTPNGGFAVASDGFLYATTSAGGSANYGSIIKLDPSTGTCTKTIDMTAAIGSPLGSLLLWNENLYGVTTNGGAFGYGSLFEYNYSTHTFTKTAPIEPYGNKPSGSFLLANNQLYGITSAGGYNGGGILFYMNPANGLITKKTDLSPNGGYNFIGKLTEINGRYFGTTKYGSNAGTIFEWSPSSNTYTTRFGFYSTGGSWGRPLTYPEGSGPNGYLTAYNNKLYGMTYGGAANGGGSIFEFDPSGNTFTKKFDFQTSAGNGFGPEGSLLLYNNKLYGKTIYGGNNNFGVLFEWDPATNILTKLYDFDGTNGKYGYGGMVLYNGKFYGTTKEGGSNNAGVIFEFDPSDNTYIKKIDLVAATGVNPQGNMVLHQDKFYGLTRSGGSANLGTLFEWDPVNNIYLVKQNFTGSNGSTPEYTELTVIPAPVAAGNPGNCETAPSITIDNSNNTDWVPITDSYGNIIAEIRANGNNLGSISTSVYINSSGVREDGLKRLYLNRNITITPSNQPASPVDIRIYISKQEYESLRTATNSVGQSSGIASVNDLVIYKNSNLCLPEVHQLANKIAVTISPWSEWGYVLTASIPSFSSFYIAGNGYTSLPVIFTDFTASRSGYAALLNWSTASEDNCKGFYVQRSTDGRNYLNIGFVASRGNNKGANYEFIDAAPLPGRNLYRLQQVDEDGKSQYSPVKELFYGKKDDVRISPNPVQHSFTLTLSADPFPLRLRLTDISGRELKKWNHAQTPAVLQIDLSDLPAGMYLLEIERSTFEKRVLQVLKN